MKKLFGLLLISFVLCFVLPLQAGAAVTISLSAAAAKPGDTVMVTGTGSPDVWVAIKAVDSLGNILVFDTVKTDHTGAYSFAFMVPDGANGTIRITAGFGTNVASASLTVNQPDPSDDNGGGDNSGGDNNGGDNNGGDNNGGDNNRGDNNSGDNNGGDNNSGDNNGGNNKGGGDNNGGDTMAWRDNNGETTMAETTMAETTVVETTVVE